jgi:hypothetical protein
LLIVKLWCFVLNVAPNSLTEQNCNFTKKKKKKKKKKKNPKLLTQSPRTRLTRAYLTRHSQLLGMRHQIAHWRREQARRSRRRAHKGSPGGVGRSVGFRFF